MRRVSIVVLAAMALLVAVPALGIEPEESITIDDSHLKVSKDFPPIPLFTPAGTVQDPTLDDCKSLPFYLAVKITLAIKSDVPAKFTFSTDWPGTAESNDLDTYFFEGDGDFISDAAGSTKPETFRLAGLPNGVYYLCIANFSGANAGTTISATAQFVDLFERPPLPPTPKPSNAPPAKSIAPADDDDEPATPAVTPETVATPGPDGSATDRELVAVAGSRQAPPAEEGRSGLSIGLLALSGVIVATGAGLVIARIRRDTSLD
jgi:hypothetical protein